MTNQPKRPPPPVVEIVDPSYQPTKAEMDEEFDVPEMTLEEAARRVLEPVEVRTIPRPRRGWLRDYQSTTSSRVFRQSIFLGGWTAIGIGIVAYLVISAWMLHRRRTGQWPFSGSYKPGRHDPLTNASDPHSKRRDE